MSAAFEFLSIERLFESPLNPRRHFSQGAMKDLVESIEQNGILTPLLVRPVNGSYEIAAGHRRFRAAREIGLVRVPCLVRELDDDRFLEIITIENLHREDVHPLDEAMGYRQLLNRPGYDVAEVAAKVGKTEEYIRGRLQLLGLIPVVQESFLRNDITIGHARIIAGLPERWQEEALRECFGPEYWGSDHVVLKPIRDLQGWIRNNMGRSLASAGFDLADAELVPAAGACVNCPKGPGANLLLFAQGGKNCYDPDCFDSKLQAVIDRSRKKGLPLVSNSYHEEPPEGVLKWTRFSEIYDRPDPDEEDETDTDDKPEPEETACQFAEEAIIAHGSRRGEVVRICRNPKCPVHGEDLASDDEDARAAAREAKYKREQEALQKKHKLKIEVRRRAVNEIVETGWGNAMDRDLGEVLVRHFVDRISSADKLAVFAKQHGFEPEVPKGKKASIEQMQAQLVEAMEEWDTDQINSLAVDLLLADYIDVPEHYVRRFDALDTLAVMSGVDFAAIERRVKKEWAEKDKPKAAPAAEGEKRGRSKKSAAEPEEKQEVAEAEPPAEAPKKKRGRPRKQA